jgi:hypothetical protein
VRKIFYVICKGAKIYPTRKARHRPERGVVSYFDFSVALTFMDYNFCRIHKSLRVTSAMEAGISERIWTLEEVAALVDKELTA